MSLFVAVLVACGALGVEPQLKWSFKAESNLYAPPLVADVHPSPGLETILSDSESRRLRCVSAAGAQLWEYAGGWTKRLPSSAALSDSARLGRHTLAVGNPDGTLCCLDAETGSELWKRDVGCIEWGSAIWADINGDGLDELVAGTERSGIVALDAGGNSLWTYKGVEGSAGIRIRCVIAAADVDGDGKAEVFAAGMFGPLCVGGDGKLKWEEATGDDFMSAVVVADVDHDGRAEVYSCSRNDNFVYCFDAQDGTTRWKVVMPGAADTYSGSSLAVGDINQDGKDEILVSDSLGDVHCISCSGTVRWIFNPEKRTHAAISLGDVDGDRAIEVLVACGDHYLYCLDADGKQKWRYAADLRLIFPATIADVDGDGKTDILFCGGDKTLRCLTLSGRYDAGLIPWPSRRFDVQQSGTSLRRKVDAMVDESVALLAAGGFEQAKEMPLKEDLAFASNKVEKRKTLPRGWVCEFARDVAWGINTETKRSGASSLKVEGSSDGVSIASEPVEVDPGLRSVTASVCIRGEGKGNASVRWLGTSGVLREDVLSESPTGAGGWKSLSLAETDRPNGARWMQMVLKSSGNVWWDDAVVNGTARRPRTLRAMVNQAGYDVGAPKRFTAQSNFIARDASFSLVNEKGETVFRGALKHKGRIYGAYDNDWGFEYWRGDFSDFDAPGTYQIRIALDASTTESWSFEVGEDVIWTKTSRAAYRFFYYQRCGMEIPGFHKACHLDDAASPDGKRQYELWGGWHDAGDYNTYDNVPYVLGLLHAYDARKAAFDRQDENGNGLSDFLDEILWGAEHSRRMIAPDGSAFGAITSGYGFWGPPECETDNKPGTGDERRINGSETGNDSSRHAAAMAKMATLMADKAPWIEAAERALNRCLANNQRGPLQFEAALNLFVATRDEKYATLAKELFPGPNIDIIESVRLYDDLFHEDHGAGLKEQLTAKTEAMLALAQNPFGVYTMGPREKPNFFGTPAGQGGWHVGTSTYILEAAALAAKAYQYNPDRRYLEFAYDQINWTLGTNPFDISLMEGVGSAFPPTYHHRYTFSGVVRGAVPGSVVNGITWRGASDDSPAFDMRGLDIPNFESNEVWLPHNTMYLDALTNVQRARHP